MGNGDSQASAPCVVETGYQAWLWIDARVASFPTDARRSLGHRAVEAALDAVEAVTEASYTRAGALRTRRLYDAQRALTRLRLLLRGARDRRHLSLDQHEHAMRLLDDFGRQLGGLLKAGT